MLSWISDNDDYIGGIELGKEDMLMIETGWGSESVESESVESESVDD